MNNFAIFGANGAIGSSFIKNFLERKSTERVYTFSRNSLSIKNSKLSHFITDITDERSIQAASSSVEKKLDTIIVATGTLHSSMVKPEKTYQAITRQQLEENFLINTIAPALIIKHFVKLLEKDKKSIIAILSARVGSISDNRLGGWYSYRASKAALNMLIKTFSIEVSRKLKKNIFVGLHPGTVDSSLSKPFQTFVPKEQLFSPQNSVQCLIEVLEKLSPKDTGKIFDWKGIEIPF